MTPKEWASAATQMSRANPGLSREEIITKMNLEGMPRPTGVENKGTDKKGNLRFGVKTRSKGQTARRKQHEQTSTTEAQEALKQLQSWQATMNNMAAANGVEGANLEHAYPSDHAAEVIQDRGRAGDYTYLNPDSEAAWKTAMEQFIRTKRGNNYRLLNGADTYRLVDKRYADDLVDPYDLPGMDIDPSMKPEQIFSALPFIVAQDLSMKQTQFPGQGPLPGLTTTAGKAQWKPPALPGYDMSEEPGPAVTAPQGGGYVAPQVMESSDQKVDYTAQNVQQLAELGQKISDASLVFRAGKAVWQLGSTALSLATGALLPGVRP